MADAKRVFGDLDKSLYLMAGNMNNIDNTFEVKNVKVAALPVIKSVAGAWKTLYGYHADILGAIVNKKNRVELYGSGAAYLANPLLGILGKLTSLSFTMTELTNDYHNKFTFAVLNDKGTFVDGKTNEGSGFVIQFRSFDQFEKGYAVYVATVKNGKTSSYEKLNDSNEDAKGERRDSGFVFSLYNITRSMPYDLQTVRNYFSVKISDL